MHRSIVPRSATATASVVSAVGAAASNKMQTLHKLLTGEVSFKNKVLLKECNIVHQFGENWAAELSTYAKSLSDEQRKVIERQIARVRLTRYTIAELAAYCGDGPGLLDQNAREANVEMGVSFLKEKGVEAFEKHVEQEALNANWKKEDAKKFIEEVKAKCK
ncbi:hypothetical protein ERJ75_000033800 [Trypanosoma vivax]|uniref:Uncharacterized protein n=1 Tax=Trypanosoma vivax (strain Y486) TaxID=1055687 RepID=G0U7R6_TRYVY|nr:hypothetical protein TRVL_00462 [Trypanosoma vivax]KAH8620630.1 hypothetical protein ERJ75_000033800 [Trypanosoma vivax]CCC51924.1 conserved hypothetical protein [Trypanosoma vivax Y486]